MEQLALTYYIIYVILMVGISFYSIQLYSTKNYIVNNSKTAPKVLFIVLLLLMVFCATGDYWSYRVWYDTGIENLHFEPIWETIRSLIPWGFDVFKLLLWGGGLYLFSLMCNWHKSDKLIAYSLFALFYTFLYSYARASIAYMLILFAFYLIVRAVNEKKHNLFFVLIISIICIVIGFQMHRSMPILLMMLVLAFLIRPKRKTFVYLLILFPIVSILFNTLLYPYIVSYVSNVEDSARLMEAYLHEDTRSTAEFIKHLIEYLPILVLFMVSLANILKKKDVPDLVKKIGFSAFIIVYCAFLFYTIRAGNGLVLFYRTMNMAYPFMLLSVAYSMKHINNMYSLTLAVVGFKVLYTFLVMYQILVNPDYLFRQVLDRYIYK